MTWQPIETAPMDGTWILTFSEHASIPWVLRWDASIDDWTQDDEGGVEEVEAWSGIVIYWMHLPEPPKEGE